MHREGEETHVSEMEASGGSKEGVVRWILIAGTLFAVVLMSLVWIIPAMMQGDVEEEATVSGAISSQEDDDTSTDSILMGEDDGVDEADSGADAGGVVAPGD